MTFQDRASAGRQLASKLTEYANRPEVMVLGLPRGGVPVAFEVAHALKAPLDVFIVRKLGAPGQEELAMGAIASGGVMVLNRDVVNYMRIPDDAINTVAAAERRELARRERLYRGDRPFPELSGWVVILVDDGLATGSTMRAAVAAVRQRHPAKVVVAVPISSPATAAEFYAIADELVCLSTREPFYSVGAWYDDFTQTTDEQVRTLLALAERPQR